MNTDFWPPCPIEVFLVVCAIHFGALAHVAKKINIAHLCLSV